MKRKYLAIVLSLTMAFTAASPVMAFSDEVQTVEEASEDTLEENSVSNEIEVFLSSEDDVEMDTDEERDDDSETAQFAATEEIFDDGSENALAVGDNETSEDGWTPLEKENSISFKYDEGNKTLYFKCSGTAALPDNKTAGFSSQWASALGDKTK